jgi:hypothetical protein
MDLHRPRFVSAIVLSLSLIAAASPAFAAGYESIIDDDTNAFVPGPGTFDRNYTFGTRWARYNEAGAMPRWADHIAARIGGNGDDVTRRFGTAFGQEMYTPDAISNPKPIVNDRPYAGWLYGSAFVAASDARHERSVELRLGLVGPKAQAQQAQTAWHSVTGVRLPRGWDHQIGNELGMQAIVTQRWRPNGYQRHFDAVPHVRASVGNVLTEAAAGVTLRAGLPLSDDFGPGMTTAPGTGNTSGAHARNFQMYAFARVEGRAVAHEIFLDGNTFSRSQRVHRVPLVGESQLGAGVRYRSIGIRYTFSYTTQEFRERADSQEYGSFGISF